MASSSSSAFSKKLDPRDAEAIAKAKNMSVGDVEAVGAHCADEYCHIKTFLPFTCEYCKQKFCEDHWRPEWHKCAAEQKQSEDKAAIRLAPKPSLLAGHNRQCYSVKCKTLIDTVSNPAVHCDRCRRDYCLKHRFREDHDCDNVPRPVPKTTTIEAQKERGLSALKNFRAWASKKKEDTRAATASVAVRPKPRQPAGLAAINKLKAEAKGDAKIPSEKRVYLFVEASADTTVAKFPTGKFYYSKDWSVGRVLDIAAKALQVENVNNRVDGEEQRLRVFHVEAGRLLEFGEKIGEVAATGNTIVLLRGVGPAIPDLIEP